MKNLAAYQLLVLGGNPSPTVNDIEKVLFAAGVKSDQQEISKCIELVGKRPVPEHIAFGMDKFGIRIPMKTLTKEELRARASNRKYLAERTPTQIQKSSAIGQSMCV